MGDPKSRPFPESLVHGDLSQREDKEMSSRTDRESVPGGREERETPRQGSTWSRWRGSFSDWEDGALYCRLRDPEGVCMW